MSRVYTATYELSGDARAKAKAHYAAVDAARKVYSEACGDFGAVAFRTGYDGTAPTIFSFDGAEPPAGWREVGRSSGRVEATPHKGTKIGKTALARIAELPNEPRVSALPRALGADRDEMSDRAWHYSIGCYVSWPTRRYFVRVPRREGDGWQVPEGLTAIAESELMAAFETHNAEARRRGDIKAAA